MQVSANFRSTIKYNKEYDGIKIKMRMKKYLTNQLKLTVCFDDVDRFLQLWIFNTSLCSSKWLENYSFPFR